MTRCSVLLAVAAILAAGSSSPAMAATNGSKPPRARAAGAHDWTQSVRPTADGGFVMGNPEAPVRLVEYGSMTCPHCREFDETAVPRLLGEFVKSGKVSWEFRNYVRDALDVTASLIARCNGAKSFFPLTRALYADQPKWVAKIEQAPQEKLQPIHDLPPDREFVALAKVAGFQQWAAKHGLPAAKADQCLGNARSVDRLVAIAGDATRQFPDFPGTPTFVINGEMVELGHITADEVWPTLEGKIRAALEAHD